MERWPAGSLASGLGPWPPRQEAVVKASDLPQTGALQRHRDPHIHCWSPHAPEAQTVTTFGDTAFKEVIKLKRGLRVGPSPAGLASLAEEMRQDHVRTQGGGGCLPTWGRGLGLRGSRPCRGTLILDFRPPARRGNKRLLFKPRGL